VAGRVVFFAGWELSSGELSSRAGLLLLLLLSIIRFLVAAKRTARAAARASLSSGGGAGGGGEDIRILFVGKRGCEVDRRNKARNVRGKKKKGKEQQK